MKPAASLAELIALAPTIAHRVVRAISVEADACLPSVARVLHGQPTKRSTRDRITGALVKLGLVAEGVDLAPPGTRNGWRPPASPAPNAAP